MRCCCPAGLVTLILHSVQPLSLWQTQVRRTGRTRFRATHNIAVRLCTVLCHGPGWLRRNKLEHNYSMSVYHLLICINLFSLDCALRNVFMHCVQYVMQSSSHTCCWSDSSVHTISVALRPLLLSGTAASCYSGRSMGTRNNEPLRSCLFHQDMYWALVLQAASVAQLRRPSTSTICATRNSCRRVPAPAQVATWGPS